MDTARRLRSVAISALAASIVLAGLLPLAPASEASNGFSSRITDGQSRSALRDCAVKGWPCWEPFTSLKAGTPVRMNCWMDRSYLNAQYPSFRWFHVTARNGKRGFVHSSLVTHQTRTPHCSRKPNIWAALRAGRRIGQKQMPSMDKELVYQSNPNYWTGWCTILGQAAWRGMASLPGGHAKTQGDRYRWGWHGESLRGNPGRPWKDRPPPGALVFWDSPTGGRYGHVAVSLGNGRVATTVGAFGSAPKRNERLRITHWRNSDYRGWVAPWRQG